MSNDWTGVGGMRVEDLLQESATILATASQTRRPMGDLLSQLPAEARDKAVLYARVYASRNPGIRQQWDTVGEALMAAFPWHRTREGADYWLRVYNDVMGRETITPCVPEASTNSLNVNTIKLNDFFEY